MASTVEPGNHLIIKLLILIIKISASKHKDRHIYKGFQRPQILLHWFRSSCQPTEL